VPRVALLDLLRHPLLEESLKKYFGDDTTPAHLKLADVPGEDTTRLIPCSADSTAPEPFPLVAVRNVFILPGACSTPVSISMGACWEGVLHD